MDNLTSRKFEWHVEKRVAMCDVAIYGFDAGNIIEATFESKRRDPALLVASPTLAFEYSDMQMIFQQLWNIGYRPQEHEQGGTIQALRDHIKFAESVVNRVMADG